MGLPLHARAGKRLFADGVIPTALRLIDSKVSTTGVVMGTSEPAGDVVTASFSRGYSTQIWLSSGPH